MVRSSRGSVAGPGADRLTAPRRYHLTEVNSVVPNDLATSVMGGASGSSKLYGCRHWVRPSSGHGAAACMPVIEPATDRVALQQCLPNGLD